MSQSAVTGVRRGRMALVWTVANVAIGYCASLPLLSAVTFSYYVRAKVWGTVSAPYHGAEAWAGVAIIVIGGGLAVTAAVVVNRALRRRLALRRWHAVTFWLVTTLLLLVPSAYFIVSAP